MNSGLVMFGASAAAVTALIIAAKHLWALFVTAVRTAVHDEITRFHRGLDDMDSFWSERFDKIEKCVKELKDQLDELSKRLTDA